MATTDRPAPTVLDRRAAFPATEDLPHPRATVRRIFGRWWVTLWADRDELADDLDANTSWLQQSDAMDWAAQRVHYERLAAGQIVTNHRRPPR